MPPRDRGDSPELRAVQALEAPRPEGRRAHAGAASPRGAAGAAPAVPHW